MRVLVATKETQGEVRGDYAHTVDGELVTPVTVECCEPRCGCDRGFPGLASSRATTTAIVVDRPGLGRAELCTALRDTLEREGWLTGLHPIYAEMVVQDHLRAIEKVCATFAVGTIVRRRGQEVFGAE